MSKTLTPPKIYPGFSPEEKQARRIARLKKRGQSDLMEVRDSVIHGSGVYATKAVEKGEYLVEYVGLLINKEESEKRAWEQYALAEETGAAAVYIFNLTEKWDLDGSFDWNPSRLLNHSCRPNCEAVQDSRRIYIQAMRNLKKGEELTFDYGFEAEMYHDHPCRCGEKNCIGYIVGQDHYPALAALQKEAGETVTVPKSRR